jgi:hypothetical protein
MIYYLASPYTHKDEDVRERRYNAACRATAELIRRGFIVISPIVHSHPLTKYGLPGDWNYWEKVDREIISRCDCVLVLALPGWDESKGVLAELKIAEELGKPIGFIYVPYWRNVPRP